MYLSFASLLNSLFLVTEWHNLHVFAQNSCAVPATPTNGIWNSSDCEREVPFFQTCHLVCNQGYELSSSSSFITCEEDGKFMPTDRPACADTDECESTAPCEANLTCINTPGSFFCSAINGTQFDMLQLEDSKPNCSTLKCGNKMECVSVNGTFICQCLPGFIGSDCHRDKCVENPCDNKGKCLNIGAGFKCDCAKGFQGWICKDDIDECRDDPCTNEGKCRNIPGGFACFCAAGFAGTICEQTVALPGTEKGDKTENDQFLIIGLIAVPFVGLFILVLVVVRSDRKKKAKLKENSHGVKSQFPESKEIILVPHRKGATLSPSPTPAHLNTPRFRTLKILHHDTQSSTDVTEDLPPHKIRSLHIKKSEVIHGHASPSSSDSSIEFDPSPTSAVKSKNSDNSIVISRSVHTSLNQTEHHHHHLSRRETNI